MGRTISNPANNSSVISSVIRTELQTLENEISGVIPNYIPVGAINATGTPSSTTFLRGDGSWQTIGGVTTVSVVTANGVSGTVANPTTTPAITLTLGAITPSSVNGLTLTANSVGFSVAGGTTSKTLTLNNSLSFSGTDTTTMTFPTTSATIARTDAANTFTGHQTIEGVTSTGATGTGNLVFATSPTLTTPVLGAATATSINGNTFTTGTYTLTGTAAKTLNFTNSLTLSGTDSTTMTFPATSATVAGLGTAQTFTGQNKFNNFIDVNNAVTVTTNAGTVPVTFRLNTFTNSSAAAMTITLATASAVDGQMTIVRIYDFSAVAEGITWVNTENSTVTAPATSNGSTTLPLTVGFMFNSATSKWRCLASA